MLGKTNYNANDSVKLRCQQQYPSLLSTTSYDLSTYVISCSPFTVFAGVPPHTHGRLTAVLQYSNGTSTLWKIPPMTSYLDAFADDLYFYLAEDCTNEIDSIPLYSSFAMYLAREYSEGGITVDHNIQKQIHISDDNQLLSISIMSHRKQGVPPPREMDNWFVPIARDWRYTDDCQFVLHVEHLREVETFDDFIRFDHHAPFFFASHCNTYDHRDTELHMTETYLPDYKKGDSDENHFQDSDNHWNEEQEEIEWDVDGWDADGFDEENWDYDEMEEDFYEED